jgi:hypothetical protein
MIFVDDYVTIIVICMGTLKTAGVYSSYCSEEDIPEVCLRRETEFMKKIKNLHIPHVAQYIFSGMESHLKKLVLVTSLTPWERNLAIESDHLAFKNYLPSIGYI